MSYFWLVLQVAENEKYYAYAMQVGESANLLYVLSGKNIVSANICKSKKQAKELAEEWNEGHKANGRYMFDTPLF